MNVEEGGMINSNSSTNLRERFSKNEPKSMIIVPPPSSWLHNRIEGQESVSEEESSSESDGDEYDQEYNHLNLQHDNDQNQILSSGHVENHKITPPINSFSESMTKSQTKLKIKKVSSKNGKHNPIQNNNNLKTHDSTTNNKRSSPFQKSWTQTATQTIPDAAKELITSTSRRAYHYTRLTYNSSSKVKVRHSEIGNSLGGYHRDILSTHGIRDLKTGEVLWLDQSRSCRNNRSSKSRLHLSSSSLNNNNNSTITTTTSSNNKNTITEKGISNSLYIGIGWEDEWDRARASLPPFSSLPWIDRQLVKEWRTCDYISVDGPSERHNSTNNTSNINQHDTVTSSKQQQQQQLSNTSFSIDDHSTNSHNSIEKDEYSDDHEFDQARTLVPQPLSRPPWENASSCYTCRQDFGPTLLRHHCRLCGRSYCQSHSRWNHKLPHLGYDPDVPERVCIRCKQALESQNLAERIAWRMARCRDYLSGGEDELCPYFETGVDTVEDVAYRLTRAALNVARSIPLGAQATVAVETLDVLRKHGLKGLYGLVLRKEFLAAADLLCKVTGINKKVWPLSVHELSAAIFYALAQHRALRGVDPEREHRIHSFVSDELLLGDGGIKTVDILCENSIDDAEIERYISTYLLMSENDIEQSGDKYDRIVSESAVDETLLESIKNETTDSDEQPVIIEGGTESRNDHEQGSASIPKKSICTKKVLPFTPVCSEVSDSLLSSLIFYAPVAMNFIYAKCEVDMQILAAQQGWRLIYCQLSQLDGAGYNTSEQPGYALFVHSDQKIACLSIRGTSTIHDVVTDIKAMPVPFPDYDQEQASKNRHSNNNETEDDWMSVDQGYGLALCGMAGAAYNLFRENIDSLLLFARRGYRIRLAGHSLGGSVAALLGSLVRRHFEYRLKSGDELSNIKLSQLQAENDSSSIEKCDLLRVYSYGSPACVDDKLADFTESFVVNCVLHDDVVPRLTPTSIRGLLKHLLRIRETWVKTHLANDIMAIKNRAKTYWAPKLRSGFTRISASSSSLKVYKRIKSKRGKSSKAKSLCKPDVKENIIDETANDIPTAHDNVQNETIDQGYDEPNDDSGMIVDGDCFYEAEESLVEQSDDESDKDFDSIDYLKETETPSLSAEPKQETMAAVLLEELPLPRMFIPGRIAHIYTHRGGYKIAIVPRAFRELRRISLAGNMLKDHTSKAYYEALLECRSIRRAKDELPVWTGFDEESFCSCCASRFTWASTFESEAQEARDKHNCRSCGSLVCEACSLNRLSIPSIGIFLQSRVCDRCYNDMGSVLRKDSDNEELTRSFIEEHKTTDARN
jgi:hypothetical protein